YFGFNTRRLDTLLPTNALLASPNTGVTFSSANNPTTAVDHNGISYVEIIYPREFNFNGASIAPFSLPEASGQRYLSVVNFNTSGGQGVLYDLTNKLRLTAVTAGGDTLKFMLPPAIGERKMVLVNEAPTVVNSIATLKPVPFIDFTSPSNRGNFIIVTHKHFRNDGSGNDFVNEYKQLKNSHGFQTVVIDIEELYDQFGHGIETSPLCYRNFTDYVLASWTGVPGEKNMLLVGKGLEWHPVNDNPTLKPFNYVPTWGYPGSDVLLTAQPNNPVPRINIGRLSILQHFELKNYKDKVEQYVAAQNAPQTIADKSWMKRVMHLAGGENETDQFVFQYILNLYADQIEDSVFFGGDATMFSKNSSDPISMATSAAMDSLISGGVSMITFFGHSSYQSLDFNLNDPYNYHNDGKYPLIVTNGCLVGNLFTLDDGFGGKFTFAQNRGSIGFLAASNFSVSNSLQLYTDNFYRNLTKENYHATIGQLITNTVSDAVNYSGNNVDRMVAEQMLYQGDPSLRLNTFAEPDYAIETQSVYFNPEIVSAGVDSFTINVVVTNIGKAVNDSIYIDITRTWPNGDQALVVHEKVKAPYYIDTFSYKMPNPVMTGLGLNQFMVKIDAEHDVDELSETNNQIGGSIIVQSDDVIPVFPYDFSIVNEQNVKLKASTVNPFVQNGHFVFQIDTTENFNSVLLKTTNITQSGGVVAWQPAMTMQDSTVYYWRTSVDTIGGKDYSWHKSSFVFINGSSTGWNQSHYFQFKDNKYVNVELGTDRQFTFVDDIKTLGIYNGVSSGYGGTLNWDEIGFYINGTKVAKWTCGANVNWLFAVIDSATGINWESYPQGNGYGQFGNIHCNNAATYNAFYFNTTDPLNHQTLINFIDSIPTGFYVLAMSINNPGYAGFTPALEGAFESIGAQHIDTMTTLRPYALFA
ncbi:MAG TPA: C25 family cysteine peptidase, partial [Chitinophagales bacterium]|nr:C25 family cysteine peptidase [Chitinophagales bacterium]